MKTKRISIRILIGVLFFLAALRGRISSISGSHLLPNRRRGLPERTQNNRHTDQLQAGQSYTLTTYNIGFGAYEPTYSFFMDTGKMKDGDKTRGKYSRAYSRERELANTKGSIRTLMNLDCDFYFVQEADVKATRSYEVNQVQMLQNSLKDYGSIYTSAFHSAYLFYPLTEPHGKTESGLVTFSRYPVTKNIRYQFPVTKNPIVKFTDLDRCFTASYLKVDTKRDLVLVNLHMSAYDKGGVIRQKQLKRLNEFRSPRQKKEITSSPAEISITISPEAKISMSLVRKFQSGYTNSLTPIWLRAILL